MAPRAEGPTPASSLVSVRSASGVSSAGGYAKIQLDQPITLAFDANLENPVAKLSIPLGAHALLDGGPARIVVPRPWGVNDQPIPFQIRGDGPAARLELEVPVRHAGAWTGIAPRLHVTPGDGSGTSVLELHAPALIRDSTAHARASLENTLTAHEGWERCIKEDLASARDRLAHPEAIHVDADAGVARWTAELTALEPTVSGRLTRLAPLADGLAPGIRLAADSSFLHLADLPPEVRKDLAVTLDRLAGLERRRGTAVHEIERHQAPVEVFKGVGSPRGRGIETAIAAHTADLKSLLGELRAIETERPAIEAEFATRVTARGAGDQRLAARERYLVKMAQGKRLVQESRHSARLAVAEHCPMTPPDS